MIAALAPMLSAFDRLLANAAHAWQLERDMGHGKATNWRHIVQMDVLDAARELFPDIIAAPPPTASPRGSSPATPPSSFEWQPSRDWQLAASHDDTFTES